MRQPGAAHRGHRQSGQERLREGQERDGRGDGEISHVAPAPVAPETQEGDQRTDQRHPRLQRSPCFRPAVLEVDPGGEGHDDDQGQPDPRRYQRPRASCHRS